MAARTTSSSTLMAASTDDSAPGRLGRTLAGALPYAILILFTLPILLLYFWLTYSSFFTRVEGLKPAGPFTLENWRFLWAPGSVEQLANKPPIIPLTINTIVFSLATAIVVLLISSMAGYALSRL